MDYSFGEKLRELRNRRNLTQDDLANELNIAFGSTINKGMISKWENDREEPRMDAIRNISKYFNIALDDLLNLNNSSPNASITSFALNSKDERDIAKDLEKMLADLQSDEALAFNGEPMDEETKRLFHLSLENSMRLAKEMAKQKFTPNKYKK